ncbi:hypothetical protein H7698_26815 [Pseudomonas sp. p50]|uniref:hypothetical protein n=1 Tax=Pseudomonas sp. p50(2008) TaxID=2816832 RepID=UPI00188BC931|nr:hypothetical protein [Pseudomonas sp. p50(2008)]MBF4559691.1 hypothetical protein [Pseudomonas sp. p50(2008)]
MQQSSSASTPVTGALIASFRHGKGFPIFILIVGLVMLGMACFVLYLSTILPAGSSGPVSVNTSRGTHLDFSSPQMMMYFASAFLAVIAAGLFGLFVWQKRLRQGSYEVYEQGIAHIIGAKKEYVPFVQIEDLYLFSSGQAAISGLITNLAYRRNANEPFHRVIHSLKGFHDFQRRVRELHVRERLPAVMQTLEGGGVVTFKYVPSSAVWGKRMKGNFLDVETQPILMTREFLEVQGRKVPMSSLRTVDLSAWSELVVIKDEAGNEVLSTVCTGILSHDLFLATLDAILDDAASNRAEPVPVLQD